MSTSPLFLLLFILTQSAAVHAEMKVYSTTDNTGLNKKERIDAVETYLTDMSKSINQMETRLFDSNKKMSELESSIKKMQDNQDRAKKGDRPADYEKLSDIEKLRADFTALKTHDLEEMNKKISEIADTVKAVQESLKELQKERRR